MNPEVKKWEIEAIRVAESNDPPSRDSLISALNLLEKAIKIVQNDFIEFKDQSMKSLLNNKAQILRLLARDSEAFECLNLILSDSIDKNNNVIRQASAQRGWLHFRSGDNEAAFKDFDRAAKLGCLESKRMAVRCNPYAAMCNQMLQELIGSTFYTK